MRKSCLVVGLALVWPSALSAQGRFPPDTLRNLRVLPASTTPQELVAMMRGFTVALGVRCPYCHVGVEGQDLSTFDFPADERPAKETARAMIRMVQAINGQHLSQLARRQAPPVEVSCATCHRGTAVPRSLSDVVVASAQAGGLDSAVRAYRALRVGFYQKGTYDFTEGTLLTAGQALRGTGKLDEALGIFRLNIEFFPGSVPSRLGIGDVFRSRGDTSQALASYREALALDPNDQAARQRLRDLGQR